MYLHGQRRNLRARLEGAPEGLIPRLRGSDAAYDLFVVAHIEIEVGEKLLLGQGVSRVDAQIGSRPGRVDTRRAAHLNAPPNTQAIGQAGLECRGHVEITLALELCPQSLPQRGAGHLSGTGTRRGIVGTGKVETSATLGQVVPGSQPGALEWGGPWLHPGWPFPVPAPPGPHDRPHHG